eukprot:149008-Alexandrium_andersonii.AAC.1
MSELEPPSRDEGLPAPAGTGSEGGGGVPPSSAPWLREWEAVEEHRLRRELKRRTGLIGSRSSS